MRSYEGAVKYAEGQRLNPAAYVRHGSLCQRFARSCVGAGVFGGSALSAWHSIPSDKKAEGRFVPGGLSYWDDPSRSGESGHATFNITKGMTYSTDILREGRVSLVPYGLIEDRWNMRYLGTILWTPSGWIDLPRGATPAPPSRGDGPRVSPWSKGAVYLSKLHYGQKNSGSVRRLQYMLRKKGFTTVSVTGNYDAKTDTAVRAWQKSIGHTPDKQYRSFIGPVEFGLMFKQPPYARHYS